MASQNKEKHNSVEILTRCCMLECLTGKFHRQNSRCDPHIVMAQYSLESAMIALLFIRIRLLCNQDAQNICDFSVQSSQSQDFISLNMND